MNLAAISQSDLMTVLIVVAIVFVCVVGWRVTRKG